MSNVKTQSLIKRLARGTVTLLITGAFIAIAGTSVWQGSTLLTIRAAAVEKPLATEPLLVSTGAIKMVEGYEVARRFTGQIEAAQTVQLSFEQGGTLASVLVDEGDRVEKGDVIARLDNRLLKAEITQLEAARKALEAQLELATLTNQRKAKLKEEGFASAQTADQSRISLMEINARIAEINAGILATEIRIEKTEIRAPFSGIVNERAVDPGNTIGGGQPVISLKETDAPIFRVGVDPDLAEKLDLGQTISIRFGDTAHKGAIIGIVPQIDAQTRTRIIRIQLEDEKNNVFGQTGEAIFSQFVNERGAWLPLTAIEDGVRGLWTVKTIRSNDDFTIGVEAVEIVYANSKEAFVRGTFKDGVSYIDKGIHRVVKGQTVRVAE